MSWASSDPQTLTAAVGRGADRPNGARVEVLHAFEPGHRHSQELHHVQHQQNIPHYAPQRNAMRSDSLERCWSGGSSSSGPLALRDSSSLLPPIHAGAASAAPRSPLLPEPSLSEQQRAMMPFRRYVSEPVVFGSEDSSGTNNVGTNDTMSSLLPSFRELELMSAPPSMPQPRISSHSGSRTGPVFDAAPGFPRGQSNSFEARRREHLEDTQLSADPLSLRRNGPVDTARVARNSGSGGSVGSASTPAPAPLALARMGSPSSGGRSPMLSKFRSGANMTKKRKIKTFTSATVSAYCHICGRTNKTQKMAACSNLRMGTCRKAVCRLCFDTNGWDWNAAERADSNWVCTHCLECCPEFARCFIYERANSKRKEKIASDKSAASSAVAPASSQSLPGSMRGRG